MRDEGGGARRGDLKKKKSGKRTKPDSIRQNERSIMKTFEEIWALLAPEGEYKRRRGACERLWQGYEPGRQEAIYTRIAGKLARGEFVIENPYLPGYPEVDYHPDDYPIVLLDDPEEKERLMDLYEEQEDEV